MRTRSPISGEMSLPNCCRVVRKRLSLLSCRAPQAGGSWWVDSEALEEVAGPLLNPLGVDGAPLMAVGEWLLPFITARGEEWRGEGWGGLRILWVPWGWGPFGSQSIGLGAAPGAPLPSHSAEQHGHAPHMH